MDSNATVALAPVQPSPWVRGAKDIAFGSIAGMLSKIFEHPFDLAKVRLQSQVLDETARFSGPLHCLQDTWKNEGFRGLYRGLPPPVAGSMLENASLFLAYSEFQHLIRAYHGIPFDSQLPLHFLALAAAGAGGVTSFILTPIELIKCKMQVQMLVPLQVMGAPATRSSVSVQSLPGPFAILGNVLRKDGWRGLWLGQTGTFIREVGGGAVWFGSNELIAKYFMQRRAHSAGRPASDFSKRDLSALELATAGGAAGAIFNLALFPADSVKSMMQTEEELRPQVADANGKFPPRRTFWQTGVAMWRAQGLKGLYAGCGVTVARAIPSSGMIFLIYDTLSQKFG